MERTTVKAPATQADKVVLSYPDNQLKDQVRDLKEALNAFTVAQQTFFEKN